MSGETTLADDVDDELVVVWRVGGVEFDVDAFLQRFPEFEPDGVFRKGESQGRGAPAALSGFNVTLIDACSRAELEEELRLALDEFQDEMDAAGHEAEQGVDIGLMFREDALVSGLRLDATLLRRLADLGLELEFSVYLCSSDEEDEEPD